MPAQGQHRRGWAQKPGIGWNSVWMSRHVRDWPAGGVPGLARPDSLPLVSAPARCWCRGLEAIRRGQLPRPGPGACRPCIQIPRRLKRMSNQFPASDPTPLRCWPWAGVWPYAPLAPPQGPPQGPPLTPLPSNARRPAAPERGGLRSRELIRDRFETSRHPKP